MNFPDYANLPLNSAAQKPGTEADWRAAALAADGGPDALGDWQTIEQIPVKPVYGPADLREVEHLGYTAGLAPYLRGPYATMYVLKPWTIRQYAGFSTARSEERRVGKECRSR